MRNRHLHRNRTRNRMPWLDTITFDERGLVPVVAQDARTGEVLMLAWASREALQRTLQTGRAHYWSRSRGALWMKGETSGHAQEVVDVRVDCDGDAVLYRVRQTGPACHTGERSCFYRTPDGDAELGGAPDPRPMLARLEEIIADRERERPEGSYTTYLFAQGTDKVLKKLGEETAETIVAAKNADNAELRSESADLLFHLMVLWRARGLDAGEVWGELERRFGAAPRPGSTEARPSRAREGS
ncbi:MAG TPA: bifunctional phosphoribosyl-AMP cyclohydrolase/phosphoribosyl-ATP diphosphatase HisIE [Longimicrobium sp.]|nr:bifunctional phosphoribosyl-AMP cyclohydrolase/phosphoribosyl-ATP diphosphatase HisIE [Longimicrobium sp.]